jgi:EAL domain-containing protein (putative c-di-GMP-specific phosphodiesterase class I)
MTLAFEQAVVDPGATRRFVRPRTGAIWIGWTRETRHRAFDAALGGLRVAFQPIIAARSGADERPRSYEALARAQEPGLEAARDLVDLAVELGRTVDLGIAVHRRVAEILRSRPDVTVFVNVDVEEFLTGMSGGEDPLAPFAGRVVLELTERAPVGELPQLRERAECLRARGYRFAIDDLGGGYAGLTSLALMRPDFVKIDQALVRGIDRDPVKEKIVSTIVALCSQLGVQCIVEGVETHAERGALLAVGADLMQGYLFSQPRELE